jgi:hypothetical protein
MMEIVYSVNKVPIRLTEERWFHIAEEHNELAGYYFDVLETVKKPQVIYSGKEGALIAIKSLEEGDKNLVVIYKELEQTDGFIITAFLSHKVEKMKRRKQIWP